MGLDRREACEKTYHVLLPLMNIISGFVQPQYQRMKLLLVLHYKSTYLR